LPFDLGHAHELYRALFGAVEHLIEGKHLLIVPSGPLTALPFQVLVSAQPASNMLAQLSEYAHADWLAKRNAVTILPSVSSLKVLRESANPSKATQPYLGFGDPLLSGPDGSDRTAWKRQSCADVSLEAIQVASRGMQAPTSTFVRADRITDVALLSHQWPLPETTDEVCSVSQSTGRASMPSIW